MSPHVPPQAEVCPALGLAKCQASPRTPSVTCGHIVPPCLSFPLGWDTAELSLSHADTVTRVTLHMVTGRCTNQALSPSLCCPPLSSLAEPGPVQHRCQQSVNN